MCSTYPLMFVHFEHVYKEINSLPRLPRILIGNWAAAFYSCGWFESRRLDKSYGWLHPRADSSSGGWIRVADDSILRLTRVLVARYELRLTPSNGWLEFQRLDRSYSWLEFWRLDTTWGWFRPAADHVLRLTRVPVAWLDLRVTYT